jgi:hypothetical protein
MAEYASKISLNLSMHDLHTGWSSSLPRVAQRSYSVQVFRWNRPQLEQRMTGPYEERGGDRRSEMLPMNGPGLVFKKPVVMLVPVFPTPDNAGLVTPLSDLLAAGKVAFLGARQPIGNSGAHRRHPQYGQR